MAKKKGGGGQGSARKKKAVKKPGSPRGPGLGDRPSGPVSRPEASEQSLPARKERKLQDTNVKRSMSHVSSRTRQKQAKRDSR